MVTKIILMIILWGLGISLLVFLEMMVMLVFNGYAGRSQTPVYITMGAVLVIILAILIFISKKIVGM